MDKSTRGILLLLVLLMLTCADRFALANANFYGSNDEQLYVTPDECRANEYYDLISMKCALCDDGLHLVPAKDSEYLGRELARLALFRVLNSASLQLIDPTNRLSGGL